MTNDEIQRRAEQANQVLYNPIFIEAFDKLKDVYYERWENTGEHEKQKRESIWNRLKAIQEVRREFIRILNAQKILEK